MALYLTLKPSMRLRQAMQTQGQGEGFQPKRNHQDCPTEAQIYSHVVPKSFHVSLVAMSWPSRDASSPFHSIYQPAQSCEYVRVLYPIVSISLNLLETPVLLLGNEPKAASPGITPR